MTSSHLPRTDDHLGWAQRLAQALVDIHGNLEHLADEITPDPREVDEALAETLTIIRAALPPGTLEGHGEEAAQA